MDQQTAQLMMQVQEQIDGLWRYLGHGQAADNARREAEKWRESTEVLRRELESNLLKMSQQFSANMTASAVIGYASYFTVWNFTREYINSSEASFVGIMGITSVCVYVLWELFIIHMRMKGIGEMGALLRDLISPDIFEERRVQIVRREANAMRVATPVWRLVFTYCVGSIMIGGAVLVKNLYANL